MTETVNIKKRFIIALVALSAVSGCANAKERAMMRAANEIEACKERGIEEGTQAFEACRLEERAAEERRRAERMRWSDDFRAGPAAQTTFHW